jgi:hypothetical protein
VAAEEAKAYPVADAPCRHARADRVDYADDLVPGHDRLAGVGTDTFDPEEIAMADPAGEDTYAYVAGFGIEYLALDEFESTLAGDLKSAICRHGRPLGLVGWT